MYMCYFDNVGFISPIMSKTQPLKGHGLMTQCNSLAGTCCFPECFWYSLQLLANSMQFFNIAGQYTPLCETAASFYAPLGELHRL